MSDLPRYVPANPRIDPSGDWLEWDPYSDRDRDWSPSHGPDGLLDTFAALARPWTPAVRNARILEIATAQGPLSFCACGQQHVLRWRMAAPSWRPPVSSELLTYWISASHHVNALRRLMADLSARPGQADDWDVVWPDRPGGRLAMHPDPDLLEGDDLERPSLFGDLAWERRQIARHLESWVGSFHGARAVRWDEGRRSVLPTTTGLLDDIGTLLVEAFITEERIRTCTGTVHGQPCRITWSIKRNKPRDAPSLCEACYALYRQKEAKGGTTG